MKISRLIFISISFILVLFSITTYVNYKQSEEVRDNAEFLSLSSNTIRQSNQFQRNILYMDRSLKGYVVTGEDYLLQTYDSAFLENDTLLNELSASIPANSPQQEKLVEIKKLYTEWLTWFAKPLVVAKQKADSIDENAPIKSFQASLREDEKVNRSLQQKFRELQNAEYTNREQRRIILDESEQRTKFISIVLTALSIIIGVVIALLLARHISRRIAKMVNMANNIAEGNYNVQVHDKANDELTELTLSLNHMAKMLEENISLLKRKNLELDQFAHIVSHDLKAPLRGIDNVISWIQEDHGGELPSKVHEYLQLILGRTSRLENLIQGILSYARIGKENSKNEEVDLPALINEIAENLEVKPGLSVSVDKTMPVINTEKIPLTQIFSNLISNAIKYHDKPNGEIKIYHKTFFGHYEFFVEDDGPGIDKKYHDKIFVIFQTLKERDSFESTGVGLAIVKKILDDRKEQIRITSKPGGGAIFSFTWSKL